MGLQHFIKQESTILESRILFMLTFSGLATGLLVSVINHAADNLLTQNVEGRLLLLYLTVFLLYIYTLKYSLAHTIYPFGDALYRVRVRLVGKACECALREFEELGGGELHDRLRSELNLAAQLLPWVTYSAQAAAILVFCLIYLAWLSFSGFLIISATLATAALWHIFIEKKLHHEFEDMDRVELEFSGLLNGLTKFAVELRGNPVNKRNFLKSARAILSRSESLKLTVDKQTISSIMSIRITLFLLLAIFVFLVPVYDPKDTELIFKITVVTFFIVGPITQLVYALPLLLRLDSALTAVYALESRLDAALPAHGEASPAAQAFTADFHELRLASSSFGYSRDKEQPRLFDDLNLILRQGEVVFLHGPAACGKTTLLKLLSGLYTPTSGSLYVDKHRLKDAEYPIYRGLFACAFRDLAPTSELHIEPPPTAGKVVPLLERAGLETVVEYEDGRFLHAPLSHTQQRRLLMISVLLQERPLYLFDDCDTDLDDEFSRLFYQDILEELRAEGKTVVAVTHDPRWLPLADRIWTIEGGGVKSSAAPADASMEDEV